MKIKFGHVNIDGRLSNWTSDFLFKEVFKSLKKKQSMKSLLLKLEGMFYQNNFDKKSDKVEFRKYHDLLSELTSRKKI